MKTYITFDDEHVHRVNGKTFDLDCVAVIECKDAEDGRAKAFEYFGSKFCFEYHEDTFDMEFLDKWFPRGLVPVNESAPPEKG